MAWAQQVLKYTTAVDSEPFLDDTSPSPIDTLKRQLMRQHCIVVSWSTLHK